MLASAINAALQVLTQRCSRAEAERDALVRCCEGATPQRRQVRISLVQPCRPAALILQLAV